MAGIFENKCVMLGVTGGVAIYKTVALASRLTQLGALVDVVMTPAAMEFVAPLMFASVTRRQVYFDQFAPDRRPDHIALAERADVMAIAPATANTMAKLAAGLADNLLTATVLAGRRLVLLAPAMNHGMWEAKPTRRNVECLRRDGYRFVGPGTGNLACGDTGIGRMAEPEEILEAVEHMLLASEPGCLC